MMVEKKPSNGAECVTLKTNYEGFQTHASNPFVGVREHIVSPIECWYIITKSRKYMRPARVLLEEKTNGMVEGRTGDTCWLRYEDNATIAAIGQRIADTLGLPLATASAMQVVHYNVGQEYRHHFDAYSLNSKKGQRGARWGGQRLVTALVYLNDVPMGGGTDFSKLKIGIKAKAGRMVLFHNTSEDASQPHPQSLHAGLPVQEGEKWAFNMWFHHLPMIQRYQFDERCSPQVLFTP
tara:strand:- start:4 stop:714 length:711 start_codon:yes stop_codon:yes gene_type:complete